MIAKVLYLNASQTSSVIPWESLPVTLGRGANADVRVLDQCASRLHCRILQVENQLFVQDLGSTLGTLVNGQPVEEAPLNSGDTLTVGVSTFRVDLESRTKTSLLSRIEASIKSLGSTHREHKPEVIRS
jgi:pSer/pThr/pTyr-binding forkhead associated (FHA) protein